MLVRIKAVHTFLSSKSFLHWYVSPILHWYLGWFGPCLDCKRLLRWIDCPSKIHFFISSICSKLKFALTQPTDSFVPVFSWLVLLELVAVVGVLVVVDVFQSVTNLIPQTLPYFLPILPWVCSYDDIGEIYGLLSTTVTFPFHLSKSKFSCIVTIFILGSFLVISFRILFLSQIKMMVTQFMVCLC